jgi:hypothetical protein
LYATRIGSLSALSAAPTKAPTIAPIVVPAGGLANHLAIGFVAMLLLMLPARESPG